MELIDDFQIETKKQLKLYPIYNSFVQKCLIDSDGSNAIAVVDDLVHIAYQRTKIIVKHMNEYTLHDGDHLFRVLNIMGALIPDETVKKMSIPELMLLILSAFYHDIGMAPSQKEIVAWDGKNISSDSDKEKYHRFQIFCDSKYDINSEINQLTELPGDNKDRIDRLQNNLKAEYIRQTHAHRAREILNKEINRSLLYKNKNLKEILIELCESHNENASELNKKDAGIICDNNQYVCLPFLGAILRIADILDFDSKRAPEILFESLTIQNPISVQEWNKHRSINVASIKKNGIFISAECSHPAIESSIKAFSQIIQDELRETNRVLREINSDGGKRDHIQLSHYRITLPLTVDTTEVKPQRDLDGEPLYVFHETRFTLNKNQIIDMLMGTKLYNDPRLTLRELIQNSIDACVVRKKLEESWGNNNGYKPTITISYLRNEDGVYYIKVDDNGIGMDFKTIDNYYSKVGNSYYTSREFKELKSKNNIHFNAISEFGIGILSVFMISKKLVVQSLRKVEKYNIKEPIDLLIEGHEGLFIVKRGTKQEPGTTTQIFLNVFNPWKDLSDTSVVNYIKKIIPHPPFIISIKTDNVHDKVLCDNIRTLNPIRDKNFTWQKNNNIKWIYFYFDDNKLGFQGNAIIGIIEDQGKPLKEVNLSKKDVQINDREYRLSSSIKYYNNEIKLNADSVHLDSTYNIKTKLIKSTLAQSYANVAYKGIEVPTNIFENSYNHVEFSQKII